MNSQAIDDELQYIELTYGFSDDCSAELSDYLLTNGLVKYYDDVVMLTDIGELEIGYSKAELQDKYYPSQFRPHEIFNEETDDEI